MFEPDRLDDQSINKGVAAVCPDTSEKICCKEAFRHLPPPAITIRVLSSPAGDEATPVDRA